MRKYYILKLIALLLILVSYLEAAVPQLINYQGRLTDGAGNPTSDGTYNLIFTIYNAEGTIVWQENHNNITIIDGLFHIILGTGEHSVYGSLTSAIFADSALWLGIKVGDDPEIDPRTRLTSQAYTFHSGRADTAAFATGSGWVDDGSVVKLDNDIDAIYVDDDGQVGIGTTDPNANLDVVGNVSSQDGRVHRDFLVWNTVLSSPNKIHVKTNIPTSSNTMYRFLVEGYNFGVSQAIFSEAVGYAYASIDNIVYTKNNDYDGGVSISQYRSSDGYVVLLLTSPGSTYYMGFSVSAWFVNPTNAFNIEATVYQQEENL